MTFRAVCGNLLCFSSWTLNLKTLQTKKTCFPSFFISMSTLQDSGLTLESSEPVVMFSHFLGIFPSWALQEAQRSSQNCHR